MNNRSNLRREFLKQLQMLYISSVGQFEEEEKIRINTWVLVDGVKKKDWIYRIGQQVQNYREGNERLSHQFSSFFNVVVPYFLLMYKHYFNTNSSKNTNKRNHNKTIKTNVKIDVITIILRHLVLMFTFWIILALHLGYIWTKLDLDCIFLDHYFVMSCWSLILDTCS